MIDNEFFRRISPKKRIKSSLVPCLLNTSRIVGKHRRVVWYLLLIADTDKPFSIVCLMLVCKHSI